MVTGSDCPPVRWGGMVPDQYILPVDGRVRFVGDEVAAVAATSEDAAREALALIDVEYEELPVLLDPQEALSSPVEIHARTEDGASPNLAFRHRVVLGDPEAGFRESEMVIERTYRTSYQNAGYLEPVACVAEPDGRGRLTVWCPTHDPFAKKATIARALGLEPHQVRVRQAAIGGSFGGKIHHKSYFLAGLLALRAGQPVRLLDSREEALSVTYPRMAMEIRLRVGCKRDGTLLVKEAFIVADNGAYSNSAPAILLVALDTADNMYRFRHVRNEGLLVYTNKVPSGPVRGYGNPQHTFALESLIDELAGELGMDPVELRLRNAVESGEVTVHGWRITSCGLRECIQETVQRAGWPGGRATEEGAPPAARRGLGIACCVHKSGARKDPRYEGSAAEVRATADGLVTVYCGEPELGEGARTVWALITAQELGVSLERIQVAPFDTDNVPYGFGTWASRVTTMAGKAVQLAAQDLKRRALALAADTWGVPAASLYWEAGEVWYGDGRRLTLAQLAEVEQVRRGGQALLGRGECLGEGMDLQGAQPFGNLSMAYSFSAHMAEVEVDPATGLVTVQRVVAAHDLGRAINPLMAEGQIEGGVVQGVGYGVFEGLSFDERGRVQNTTFLDYKLATAADAPAVEPVLVESGDPFGPFGAKGLAEPALVPTAAAVANAVAAATGVRIRELPLTPERVWRALRSREGGCGR